jgi:2-dehydro-3-deoxyphosphogluconate aldolase/(4S)-4-hydroxy-2-oxoglutarate aldolase
MKNPGFSWELFSRSPIVGIVRHLNQDDWPDLLRLYVGAGLTNIEVTMNSSGAADMIRYARENFGNELNVGAGTVCTMDDLRVAIEAGAGFIVTPAIVRDVIRTSVEMGIPVMPGAFSPTEIHEAWSAGASLVKVFPAAQLGPEYIKALKGPFPHIKLMPTGGIGSGDIPKYKAAGADAYGVGSPLFPDVLMKQKNWSALAAHFSTFIEKSGSGHVEK